MPRRGARRLITFSGREPWNFRLSSRVLILTLSEGSRRSTNVLQHRCFQPWRCRPADIEIRFFAVLHEAMEGNTIEEPSRHKRPQQREACRMNVVRGDVPTVGSALGRVTKSFACPRRCRKSGGPQLREDRRDLFVGVFLDLAAMWSDDGKVGLVSGVLGQFNELDARGLARRVKHLSFNRRRALSSRDVSARRSRCGSHT